MIENIKSRIDYLHLLLSDDAGVRVVVNPHCDESYYHFRRRYINIGLKSYLETVGLNVLKVAELLYYHEVSHHLNSQLVEDEMPHWLVNVLEDHRIEWSIREKVREIFGKDVSFAPLHEASFEIWYRSGKALKEMGRSYLLPVPVILIFERWSTWTGRDYLAGLEEKFGDIMLLAGSVVYTEGWEKKEEFRQDCKKVLSDVVSAKDTADLISRARWFYTKWKELFGSELPLPPSLPGIGGRGKGDMAAEEIEGSLSPQAREFIERSLEEATLSQDEEAPREWKVREEEDRLALKPFSKTPVWSINEETVSALKDTLRTVIVVKRQSQSVKSSMGRRPDPRRTENLLPNPFRRKQEVVAKGVPRTLFVIDGSGSMSGKPFYDATHLAIAFEEELGADIVLTAPDRYYKVKARDLTYAKCNGGTENLVSTAELLENYDLVIFFTDANVSGEDERFLKKNKSKKVVGLLTTYDLEDAKNWLPQFFERYVVASDIQSLAKELAFLLRRG